MLNRFKQLGILTLMSVLLVIGGGVFYSGAVLQEAEGNSYNNVISAQAEIQDATNLDSHVHGNDSNAEDKHRYFPNLPKNPVEIK
jgi:hypothetical protein